MTNLFQPGDDIDRQQERFLRSQEAYRGHPTAPGPRDAYRLRMGTPTTADGIPGVPRLRPTPHSQGPGIPGHSPAGPMQPGIDYEGWDENA